MSKFYFYIGDVSKEPFFNKEEKEIIIEAKNIDDACKEYNKQCFKFFETHILTEEVIFVRGETALSFFPNREETSAFYSIITLNNNKLKYYILYFFINNDKPENDALRDIFEKIKKLIKTKYDNISECINKDCDDILLNYDLFIINNIDILFSKEIENPIDFKIFPESCKERSLLTIKETKLFSLAEIKLNVITIAQFGKEEKRYEETICFTKACIFKIPKFHYKFYKTLKNKLDEVNQIQRAAQSVIDDCYNSLPVDEQLLLKLED